jgi:hypothetical protein
VSLGSRRATRPATRVVLQNTSRVLLLAIAVGLAPQGAAAQPDTEAGARPVIIRGSSSAAEVPTTAEIGGMGVVLRGTPPPVSLPPPIYTCAPGYLPDPSLGCAVPAVAYPPNDLDYWSYLWPYEAYAPQQRFRRARATRGFGRHVTRLGGTERFGGR